MNNSDLIKDYKLKIKLVVRPDLLWITSLKVLEEVEMLNLYSSSKSRMHQV